MTDEKSESIENIELHEDSNLEDIEFSQERLEPIQKTIEVGKKPELQIDPELDEMGECFGNYSKSAEECKICKVSEDCSNDTKGSKK